MIIRSGGKKRVLGLDEPLRHESHKKPVTRRDFLAQGFVTGSATVVAPSLLGMMAMPQFANAGLSPDMVALKTACGITGGSGMVPFIAFDLAGGGNLAGSNVLVGQQGGQMDFLTTAGYSKLGIPGNMVPNASVAGNFIDRTLGIAFHSDSAILRGIMSKITVTTTAPRVNGVVIPARSENDTGNNPHNPMYGIAKAGAKGELLTLVGSQASVSGGNSMAPMMMIDPTNQPTKVSSTADARSLVDIGDLSSLFPGATGLADTNAVMESIAKISESKLATPGVDTLLGSPKDGLTKDLVKCSYVKTAYQTDRYSGGPDTVDPTKDPAINGTGFATPIFTTADYSDNEFAKTAAIMKLVIGGFAGAGTISMGGFDYHTGDRSTGEGRDERLGKCIGACLEYAARIGQPVMIYVFSDGSVASNGMIDNSVGGRGKGAWAGDNQGTASSFFLVYNPKGLPVLTSPSRQQLGWFAGSGDVTASSSPAGNSVSNLVELVVLNYLAINYSNAYPNGMQGLMPTLFPNSVFATTTMIDAYAAFAPLSASVPPPPPPPPGTILSCGSTGNVAITANHGHSLVLPVADLDSTVPMTYGIRGTAGHPHTIVLSVAQLQSLKTPGATVTVTSTNDNGHTHDVTASCLVAV